MNSLLHIWLIKVKNVLLIICIFAALLVGFAAFIFTVHAIEQFLLSIPLWVYVIIVVLIYLIQKWRNRISKDIRVLRPIPDRQRSVQGKSAARYVMRLFSLSYPYSWHLNYTRETAIISLYFSIMENMLYCQSQYNWSYRSLHLRN